MFIRLIWWWGGCKGSILKEFFISLGLGGWIDRFLLLLIIYYWYNFLGEIGDFIIIGCCFIIECWLIKNYWVCISECKLVY